MSTEQLQSTHDPDPEQEYVLGIDEAGRGPILGIISLNYKHHLYNMISDTSALRK